MFDRKINKKSCSRAELQVVVGLALYELSRERGKTDKETMTKGESLASEWLKI